MQIIFLNIYFNYCLFKHTQLTSILNARCALNVMCASHAEPLLKRVNALRSGLCDELHCAKFIKAPPSVCQEQTCNSFVCFDCCLVKLVCEICLCWMNWFEKTTKIDFFFFFSGDVEIGHYNTDNCPPPKTIHQPSKTTIDDCCEKCEDRKLVFIFYFQFSILLNEFEFFFSYSLRWTTVTKRIIFRLIQTIIHFFFLISKKKKKKTIKMPWIDLSRTRIAVVRIRDSSQKRSVRLLSAMFEVRFRVFRFDFMFFSRINFFFL